MLLPIGVAKFPVSTHSLSAFSLTLQNFETVSTPPKYIAFTVRSVLKPLTQSLQCLLSTSKMAQFPIYAVCQYATPECTKGYLLTQPILPINTKIYCSFTYFSLVYIHSAV